MLRSHALQPLSREHHAALKLALTCERAALSGDEAGVRMMCQRALQFYAGELAPHFQIEESHWLPILSGTPEHALAERTLAEHRQLQALRTDLEMGRPDALKCFGKFLAAHVRFEERELFPALESKLQPLIPRPDVR